MTILPIGMAAADACGPAPFAKSREGMPRVFARKASAAAIPASLALADDASGFLAVDTNGQPYVLPPATRETLGGVDIMPDGTVSVDGAQIVENAAASDESVKEMLDAVFGA